TEAWVDGLLFVPRGLVFTALAVLTVSLLCRWAPLRHLGQVLGRQTLAVYVLHPMLIGLLMIAAAGPAGGSLESVAADPVVGLVYPLVVTAIIVALALPARSV